METKVAAIYNVFDGEEFLRRSMESVAAGVDLFIIVYQTVSNFGEEYDPLPHIDLKDFPKPVAMVKYTPQVWGGFNNEIAKRNLGLDVAIGAGCTHFVHMDCDEFYKDFVKAKDLFMQSGADGSVCSLYTYFRWPTLRFETADGYFVPFIHKLTPYTRAGGKIYPYYVDPTRKINAENVIQLPTYMHHFSWIRRDIGRKIRNSSAKDNIANGTMLYSYHHPDVGPGYYVLDYDKKLIEVDDFFNLMPIFSDARE